jgi:hypothetical protein
MFPAKEIFIGVIFAVMFFILMFDHASKKRWVMDPMIILSTGQNQKTGGSKCNHPLLAHFVRLKSAIR